MKTLRRLAIGVVALIATILVLFVVVVSVGVSVDLGRLRIPLQTAASQVLDREVRIDGSLTLVPTWSPTVEMAGLRIANPAGWSAPEFARMDVARVTVGVWPLLARRAVVRELTAKGVTLNLERDANGRVNWAPPPGEPAPAEDDAPSDVPLGERRPGWIREVAIEELHLVALVVEMKDALGGLEGRFDLTDLLGAFGTHDPLHLTARGKLGPEPYALVIDGGPPSDILDAETPWPLSLVFDLADTRMRIETSIDQALALPGAEEAAPSAEPASGTRRRAAVTVSVSGDLVESLERLADVDLPPWGPYSFRASLEAFGDQRFAGDLALEVGSSSLAGRGEFVFSSPPRIELDLAAPTIQLDDFPMQGWSLTQQSEESQDPGEAEAERTHDTGAEPATEPPPALLGADAVKRLNARLAISVDHVASGSDQLGKGSVVLALENGTLSVDPLDIEVPGGGAHLALTFEPTADRMTARIRAKLERFDYGILARRLDPDTALAGLFGVDVDLSTWAPIGAPLMTHANGRFDIAVFPENMDAGLVDLWAVNLLSAVGPAVDPSENSRLNCVVALLDVSDGVMREHTLMLDTSKMTVGGSAAIDFRERHIAIALKPKAKRPEFFSLATPVEVSGSFEDFGIGVDPGSVAFTAIKMATSVVTVPVRRIFKTKATTDDLEECVGALAARGYANQLQQ